MIATAWEVEELLEQILLRPQLWFGKDKLWIRRSADGQNRYAVKFTNGLPDHQYEIQVRALGGETQEDAEHFVEELLMRFTSYSDRKRAERVLLSELSAVPALTIAELARRLCTPPDWIPGEARQPLHARDRITRVTPLQAVHPQTAETAVAEAAVAPQPQKPVVVVAPKRSKYLERLLKGK